jgi:hypothetical protein
MKKLLPISPLVLALTLSGCAWFRSSTSSSHANTSSKPGSSTSQTIVTPDESMAAKVLSVNIIGRFVVLNFPEGQLPKIDQHMFLYRGGLKTGEVKIAGPQQDTSIVADIVSGDAQAGDLVRDQ